MPKLSIFRVDHGGNLTESDRKALRSADRSDDISWALSALGISYEHAAADSQIDADAGVDEVIEAYRVPVDRMMQRYGFRYLDVVGVTASEVATAESLRAGGRPHAHPMVEAVCVAHGSCRLHAIGNDRLAILECEPGDLICLPAGMEHWLEIPETAECRLIRAYSEDPDRDIRYTGRQLSA